MAPGNHGACQTRGRTSRLQDFLQSLSSSYRLETQGWGDSQTIKSAEKGCKAQTSASDQADAVGYDAGKKVKGRKIHALVDTLGLPIRLVVHSAAMQDRDGAALLLDKVRRRFPWLECVFADGG